MFEPLIIANASGFWGDRFSAPAEMVAGGPIHVLTGDYLAELTMAILYRKRRQDPRAGYVHTFLQQMEGVLGACLERGIRVVANAGGLNPAGLAEQLHELAARLGLHPRIAAVDGDDLLPRLGELQQQGELLRNLDTGAPWPAGRARPISANAYLGGWGIAKALGRGADVVVCGRVADASLVVGPAAWHFGWHTDDWDRLAGATVAGHILECGPQATGGNYPFLDELPDLRPPGFPLAELYADGSCVIAKHPDTGGVVSVGTVTAQLLYEIQSERYHTPDVTARFDTIHLEQSGPDRVRVWGVRGEPPPRTAKATVNLFGGYRNQMTVVLTGLDVEEKARRVEAELFGALGGRERFQQVDVQLIRSDKPNPPTNEEAFAHLRITVRDPDADKVGKQFSRAVVALALSSIPGFLPTSPPGDASPVVAHWPTLIDGRHIVQRVALDGVAQEIPWTTADAIPAPPIAAPPLPTPPAATDEPWAELPFGRVFGARSGDKGGNANLGVWARDAEAYAWLADWLTAERLRELLPDLAPFAVERTVLPNIWALNFIVRGLLGEGVSAGTRPDPQAKTLGEYLRARLVPMPAAVARSAAQPVRRFGV